MALTRAQKSDLYQVQSKIAGGNVNRVYYKHGVLYGDYFDLRTYHNVKITYKDAGNSKTKRTEGGKRDDSVARARVNLYRLITGNVGKHGRFKPVFGTYTFRDNVTSISEANQNFKQYITRLSKYIGYRPKYVCVPENQKRGAWHYHVVYFDLPKIDLKINDKLWNQGNTAVKMEFVRGIRDIGAYLSKYLSKEMLVSRGINQKMYTTSRGLIRPQDVFHIDSIDNILNNARVKVLTTFEGESFTQIKYKIN